MVIQLKGQVATLQAESSSQQETINTLNTDVMNQQEEIAELRANFTTQQTEIDALETEAGQAVTTFVAWGQSNCTNTSSTIFDGQIFISFLI